jgi:potassium-dependent mechanosensitive channel
MKLVVLLQMESRMFLARKLRPAAIGMFLLLAPTAYSQEAAEAEPPVSSDFIQTQRKAIEDNSDLTEDSRKQILDHYDQAGQSLTDERKLANDLRRYQRERANVGRETIALQAELDRPTPELQVNLPENATVERITRLLTQERAELQARQQALSDLTKLAESRGNRRTEIARRIGQLNQRLEQINDSLVSLSQRDTSPELAEAIRTSLRAETQKNQQEILTLRAEQALIDAQAELIPLQRDRSERRVAESEKLTKLLSKRATDRQRGEADEKLARVHELTQKAAEVSEVLPEAIADTLQMAEQLWGPDGVTETLEQTSGQLTTTRKHTAMIEKISSVTRRKFQAVRTRGIAAQWWPQIPPDLPAPAELRDTIRKREQIIPNVQHELIVLEEKRVKFGNIEQQVEEFVTRTKQVNPSVNERELERTVRSLASTRRELIDQLIKSYTRYVDNLLEATAALRALLAAITGLDTYIDQRVFWVRSVPGNKLPPSVDVSGGFRWIFMNSEWSGIVRQSAGEIAKDGWLALSVLLLPPLLLFRRWILVTLRSQAKKVNRIETESFTVTIFASLLTVGLAAPLPLLFFILSRWISMPADSELVRGVSGAFQSMAIISGVFLLLAELARPSGLGEAHFGWSISSLKPVRRWTARLLPGLLPLVFICVALAHEGLRFHSQPELRAYSNGLGRLCFIGICCWLMVVAQRLLRPGGETMLSTFADDEISWTSRSRYLWFPVLMGVIALPAVLAFFGYYITGFVILQHLLQTAALTLLIVIVGELIVRWRDVRQRALADGDGADALARGELDKSHVQVRQLARLSLGSIWIIATLMIWSDVLPAFAAFNRVQILPTVKLLRADPDRLNLADTPGQAASPAAEPAPGDSAPVTVTANPIAAMTQSATPPATTPDGQRILTLMDILRSILVLIFTFILARNIPGVLEFTLLRKMPLEPGARSAISTLVRYVLVIVGISISSSIIGLSWSKIQWLAAALTFGLGFGLQEIFANFVSGLIILIDRPIRVGDVVDVGNVGGWVTKISIRATTVTKWDRSELIVPNRDFITQQVTNWTLSNSLTRVELKVGVEYGSDPEKVRQVLLDVAHNHPAVLREPPPNTVLMEFGDNSVNFELRVFLNYDYGRLTLRDEVQRRIVTAFKQEGIVIAFPQLDLHVKSGTESVTDAASPIAPPTATPRGLQDGDS